VWAAGADRGLAGTDRADRELCFFRSRDHELSALIAGIVSSVFRIELPALIAGIASWLIVGMTSWPALIALIARKLIAGTIVFSIQIVRGCSVK
jgi:hypothetical protein